jgi:hypothetical protein
MIYAQEPIAPPNHRIIRTTKWEKVNAKLIELFMQRVEISNREDSHQTEIMDSHLNSYWWHNEGVLGDV